MSGKRSSTVWTTNTMVGRRFCGPNGFVASRRRRSPVEAARGPDGAQPLGEGRLGVVGRVEPRPGHLLGHELLRRDVARPVVRVVVAASSAEARAQVRGR